MTETEKLDYDEHELVDIRMACVEAVALAVSGREGRTQSTEGFDIVANDHVVYKWVLMGK